MIFVSLQMNYYTVSIINSILEPLTYQSSELIEKNSIVEIKLRGKLKQGIIVDKIQKPTFKCLNIENIKNNIYFTQEIIDSAKFISQYYFSTLGEALALFTPILHTAITKDIQLESNIILSQQQQKAYDFINNHDISLLFGDTGSGKTEIYIKHIEQVINNRQSAILLLPEISLTPQIKIRLKKVFGDLVEIWHSKVTKKQKSEILEKITNGTIRVIAGARSSLFLPFNNLGLIIVDEEHDDSYKSSNRPRINTKDFAIYYAKKLKAKVILGSATPLTSSYHKFPTIRLKENYYKTNKQYIFENSETSITPIIIENITKTLNNNQQVIVFLPTRANFKTLSCMECGESIKCPYCSVNMSMHKNLKAVKCHYCNYISAIPQVCNKCNSSYLSSSRMGTAEVVDILKNIYPNHTISRFDRDEITTVTSLKKILKKFNNKEIDILVGTQMLSKGHDYHEVSLSVIMGIDNILNIPDYRSREKALSTLTQVAGRSGRKSDGKVLIQTLNREFFEPFLNKYEDFIKEELQFRVDMYPPYRRLCRVLFSDKNEKLTQSNMESTLKKLENINSLEIVGYGEAPINKIANKYRYNILLRSDNISQMLKEIHKINNNSLQIDIDPISFS